MSLSPKAQINAVQIQVGTTPGNSDMWDSEWLADQALAGERCSDKSYDGNPLLHNGQRYYWRIRFRNEAGEGAWSVNASFTMHKSLAPNTPDELAIQAAPLCFVARFTDPDSMFSSAFEIHVASSLKNLGEPDMWKSGWQVDRTIENSLCTPKCYAGSPLEFGKKYYWMIRFKDAEGNASVWSAPRWFAFKLKRV